MAITETRWTEGNYQLAIISLEKPDHSWGPFAMWEVDYLFVKIVQDHLGLQKVWSDPIRCVVWMARPTPVLPVLRWWFNGRYTLQWWVLDWLIRHNLISKGPATVWQWRDLKSFSLMPSTRRARRGGTSAVHSACEPSRPERVAELQHQPDRQSWQTLIRRR